MAEEQGGVPPLDEHFAEYLGFQTRSPEPGHATGELELKPQHLNSSGTVHGGMVMTMLDSLMGHAARTLAGASGPEHVTSSMTTHFLEAVSQGRLTGSGRVTAQSETYLLTEAELRDGGRRLIATAEAVYTRLHSDAKVGDR